MRRWLLAVAGFATVLSMGLDAYARQDRIASNGPCNAQCRTDRVNGRACAVHTIYDVRKAPQANLPADRCTEGKNFSLNGAPCPASARVWIDKQAAVAFESCSKCNCQMKADDSARLFELARAGKTLLVETRDSKGVTRV